MSVVYDDLLSCGAGEGAIAIAALIVVVWRMVVRKKRDKGYEKSQGRQDKTVPTGVARQVGALLLGARATESTNYLTRRVYLSVALFSWLFSTVRTSRERCVSESRAQGSEQISADWLTGWLGVKQERRAIDKACRFFGGGSRK